MKKSLVTTNIFFFRLHLKVSGYCSMKVSDTYKQKKYWLFPKLFSIQDD